MPFSSSGTNRCVSHSPSHSVEVRGEIVLPQPPTRARTYVLSLAFTLLSPSPVQKLSREQDPVRPVLRGQGEGRIVVGVLRHGRWDVRDPSGTARALTASSSLSSPRSAASRRRPAPPLLFRASTLISFHLTYSSEFRTARAIGWNDGATPSQHSA